jgi:HAD superfamily hydrolase (TIGR01509 family)
MIKGLVFDFDGLIIDTETPEFYSWQEIFQSYNAVLPITEWGKCLGAAPEAFDIIGYLENQIGQKVNGEELFALHKKQSLEIGLRQPILPGILETLKSAKAMGLKIGLASSSPRDWVEIHLKTRDLYHWFDCIFTKDDVEKVKPEPALYQKALTTLQLLPQEAIAFEDSPNGIKAAKAAGIFCVAIRNPISSMLDVSQADLVLDSLGNFTIPQLFTKIEETSLQTEVVYGDSISLS